MTNSRLPIAPLPASAPLINQLARAFYEVVPTDYRTYCSFTSQIVAQVLEHFGVPCQRVPCQLWYCQPHHIYVVGFLGPGNPAYNPEKWDGHVVCCADHILIDAATHHFEREFKLPVPWVVTTPMFGFPTPALARASLGEHDVLLWQPPPAHADTRLPEEPQDLVARWAQALIERLQAQLPGLLASAQNSKA